MLILLAPSNMCATCAYDKRGRCEHPDSPQGRGERFPSPTSNFHICQGHKPLNDRSIDEG